MKLHVRDPAAPRGTRRGSFATECPCYSSGLCTLISCIGYGPSWNRVGVNPGCPRSAMLRYAPTSPRFAAITPCSTDRPLLVSVAMGWHPDTEVYATFVAIRVVLSSTALSTKLCTTCERFRGLGHSHDRGIYQQPSPYTDFIRIDYFMIGSVRHVSRSVTDACCGRHAFWSAFRTLLCVDRRAQ